MYDAKYIIPGLAAFLALVTLPFWLGLGRDYERVKPTAPTPEMGRACIEPREYMAASHMELLHAWRDAATRENRRQYTASNGAIWAISLSNTCMRCHADKENFCDTCHTAVGVAPYCWDCHAVPGK